MGGVIDASLINNKKKHKEMKTYEISSYALTLTEVEARSEKEAMSKFMRMTPGARINKSRIVAIEASPDANIEEV